MTIRSLLILLLAACAATITAAQEEIRRGHSHLPEPPELPDISELPDFWQPIAREIRAFYNAKERWKAGLLPPPQCTVVLETQAIIWGDPHMSAVNPATGEPDRFRLQGPHPVWGNWTVHPLNNPGPWHHPWNDNVYKAKFNPGSPDEFLIGAVSVRAHNGGDRNHEYKMKIRELHKDGCPKYVDFFNLRHEGGPIIDDPGHAGTGRN